MYRILLVEDDEALRFVYSKMKAWTEAGFKIACEASNGKDALNILANQSFDLIVTDIRMPFVDGIELLRKIKERGINTCVIFISSYDEFEYARQGLILGAFDYILKPVKEKQLTEVLGRVRQHIESNLNGRELPAHIMAAVSYTGVDLKENRLLRQVCEYLAERSGNIITMEDTAEHLKLSKDYFGKVFRQQTGITFNYFCSLVKVEYAKELIDTGNYKTYQISEMLGYSSTDYFTKVFKDITGETPSKYKG